MPEDEKPLPEFQTVIQWTGGHEGNVTVEGKESLLLSSPPIWGGLGERYSPQDFFVLAVTGCYITTFGHFLQRADQAIDALRVDGYGVVARHPEGGYYFTDIYVTMHVTLPNEAARTKVKRVIDLTEKYCMITRSVSCKVHVEAHLSPKV